ncbi:MULTISPECIES: 2-phospho-L-lactate guanylyltransferase [Haloferax]|uniref:2-phospho-L-lactate guanylyltransferase n=2 Tax=Haloferax gibbonsii TaxID=35746 RepID=A0A0K1IVA2_HALGI|nr:MULTISPECIES: 2-phospho-L-lactate guanylyltransferase [Haloferax]AKU08235.1 2-phospho-L-lactate guanylyltransferase [Haloferax gibbonsii]ELZ79812.1 2-phospho-L-lactate guanylyltransferase CofC [Haloferax gibbonsii ATCC 33959]QOS12598.1 2-phospho-L-lactate guanylyltransferase [Haloferax gibbonsii]RDZ52602.1 2-phospho-L-lactate guanylyltransferase [Haloferax sp. Atlit-4N]REA03776.1 2-phospho-L-lactate guanylyltransferase [Haloferax sp. Atlit-6N]
MRVVVPFGGRTPKTRLASFFDADERREFAVAMLRDVLDAVRAADGDPTVVADAPVSVDAPVTVDDRPLTEVVGDELGGDDPVAVVMADLALATPAALARLFETDADVVAAPGLGGGTNALVVRHPDFSVDYHGASILDHRRIARDAGCSFAEVDSMRLAVDVDEPTDLVEVLVHGEGRAREWLVDAGVRLEGGSGRVEAVRERR